LPLIAITKSTSLLNHHANSLVIVAAHSFLNLVTKLRMVIFTQSFVRLLESQRVVRAFLKLFFNEKVSITKSTLGLNNVLILTTLSEL
jgi:hypothetical protein